MTTTEPKTRKPRTDTRNVWVAKNITFNLGEREVKMLDEIIQKLRKTDPKISTTSALHVAISMCHGMMFDSK